MQLQQCSYQGQQGDVRQSVRGNCIIKVKIHSSCEIEYFVETHLYIATKIASAVLFGGVVYHAMPSATSILIPEGRTGTLLFDNNGNTRTGGRQIWDTGGFVAVKQ